VRLALASVVNDILNKGYSIQENLFLEKDLIHLRNFILAAHEEDKLKEAGIGKNAELHKDIRCDKILWLERNKLTPELKNIFDFLESFKIELNRKLFLGIKDFETHLTLYPPNSYYKKHYDQFKKSPSAFPEKVRVLSFIIYLNQEWGEGDGGELLIFESQKENHILERVLPLFGRVVFFLSEEYPHEVLKTKKERISMTGWFFK
jgi:SM-20-related protein